jgi:hypothetical protein
MKPLLAAFAVAAGMAVAPARAADISAYEKINCDSGPTKVRLDCLNRKVAALVQRLDRLEPRQVSSADVPAKKEDRYIRYGDHVTISKDDQNCLHSGHFAGFENCDPQQAATSGFSLRFRLDPPISTSE